MPSTFSKPNVKRPSQPQFVCQHFLSVQFFFSSFKHLWKPYVQSVSTASTGFYLILVLRSSPYKVERVLSQPWRMTLLYWCCGDSNLTPGRISHQSSVIDFRSHR
ncbi:hypothetical protein O181_087321, partial [Austropuccinia psidii MF-1]|nr:hypothetical protein [Austropuccinia psidii MF-1]